MAFTYPKSASKVGHNLKQLIKQEKEDRCKKGEDVLIGDVEKIVAEQCGISYHTIKQIKKGMMIPQLEIALKLARYFNVHVDEIFFLKDEKLGGNHDEQTIGKNQTRPHTGNERQG